MCDNSLLLLLGANEGMFELLIKFIYDDQDSIIRLLSLFENDKHIIMGISHEQWLTNYLDWDFFQLFRLKKATFQILLSKLDSPDLNKTYKGGHIPVPKEKQLLAFLWWLGKGETLISVSDKFGISVYFCHQACNLFLEKIIMLHQEYIQWPTKSELVFIEEEFREKQGYPGVIGAIDGCNIKFKAPLSQQESYIDKNSNHSIKLQAICTSKHIFTNIFVGFPGSAHDSRVFRNSTIFQKCSDPLTKRNYVPLPEYHLLGDKAYPLLDWLITPYRGEGQLEERQRRHNIKHSQTRMAIEHSFGILKARWRILKYINVNSIEKAVKVITACCMLHNFCLIYTDLWDSFEAEEDLQDNVDEENRNLTGLQKRHQISLLL